MLKRYEVLDDYTLAELVHQYENADPTGRIGLLRRCHVDGLQAESELYRIAAKDPSAGVRRWLARYGELFRDIRETLLKDPDPLVRASCRENPTTFAGLGWTAEHWKLRFDHATHLERLALVRNPAIDPNFLGLIIDPDGNEPGIASKERLELIRAFFSNEAALKISRGWCLANQEWEGLHICWQLAHKWAQESEVEKLVYRHLGANAGIKEQVYSQCADPVHRINILLGCDVDDEPVINLGLCDQCRPCRAVAYSRVWLRESPAKRWAFGNSEEQRIGYICNPTIPRHTWKRLSKKLAWSSSGGRFRGEVACSNEQVETWLVALRGMELRVTNWPLGDDSGSITFEWGQQFPENQQERQLREYKDLEEALFTEQTTGILDLAYDHRAAGKVVVTAGLQLHELRGLLDSHRQSVVRALRLLQLGVFGIALLLVLKWAMD